MRHATHAGAKAAGVALLGEGVVATVVAGTAAKALTRGAEAMIDRLRHRQPPAVEYIGDAVATYNRNAPALMQAPYQPSMSMNDID